MEDVDCRKKFWVACNPNTAPEVLTKLAEDINVGVREHVAQNLFTPPEVLTQLAEDESDLVKWAAHNNTTFLHHRAVQDGACADAGRMVEGNVFNLNCLFFVELKRKIKFWWEQKYCVVECF